MTEAEIQEDGTVVVEGVRYFKESYVHELRDEAAAKRTANKEFETAFEGLTADERQYILGAVSAITPEDATAGGVQLREAAKVILGDSFYEGLEVPQVSDQNEAAPTGGLTAEQVEAIVKNALEAQAKAFQEQTQAQTEEQRRNAEVESVYAEIEAQGFQRGSVEFQQMLSLGQVAAANSGDVNFEDIAKQVHAINGTQAAEGEATAETETAGAPNVPATTDVGSVGSASNAEPITDWMADAQAAGKDLLQVAMERAMDMHEELNNQA